MMFLYILGAIAVTAAIVAIILLIVIFDSWDSYFSNIPNKLYIGGEPETYYRRTYVKFKKWKKLFELNPSSFCFVRKDGESINLNYMSYNIRKTHPVFYDTDTQQYYFIDFRFLSYIQYYLYGRAIKNRISFLYEEKMTKQIVGTVQSKIDALVAESEKSIKDTLKLQEKIILRMSSEDKDSKEGNDGIT